MKSNFINSIYTFFLFRQIQAVYSFPTYMFLSLSLTWDRGLGSSTSVFFELQDFESALVGLFFMMYEIEVSCIG